MKKINFSNFIIIILESIALSLIPFGTILIGFLISRSKNNFFSKYMTAAIGVILAQSIALNFTVMRILFSLLVVAISTVMFLPIKQKGEEKEM
ncbi:MAG: hypothetical protein PWQ35_159 [Patescibacteria group bacterium]|nr:hypothetical protein [Patescibacteria group bacterium]